MYFSLLAFISCVLH